MTRTLVVTNDLPPRSGGIETFLHELLVRQASDSVAVLGPAHADAGAFDATAPYPIIRHDGAVLPGRRMVRRIQQVAGDLGCTQVLIPSAMPVGFMVPALVDAGLPVAVAMTHGNEAGWARVPGVTGRLEGIAEAGYVTYLGEYTRARIARALPARARLRRLAPAVDADRFRPDVDPTAFRRRWSLTGHTVIGCVSRLVERKGQDRLIEALPEVRRHVPDAVVLLVGEGPDRSRLERRARRLGIERHVVFTGRVADDDLPAAYASCDIVALPCRTRRWGIDVEGLGIVLLEGSASGRPVIAGDSGGAPDAVVDGETGLVVPDEVSRLAAAVIELASDDMRADAMGAAGRAWVMREWTWQVPARRLADMLAGRDPDAPVSPSAPSAA